MLLYNRLNYYGRYRVVRGHIPWVVLLRSYLRYCYQRDRAVQVTRQTKERYRLRTIEDGQDLIQRLL